MSPTSNNSVHIMNYVIESNLMSQDTTPSDRDEDSKDTGQSTKAVRKDEFPERVIVLPLFENVKSPEIQYFSEKIVPLWM